MKKIFRIAVILVLVVMMGVLGACGNKHEHSGVGKCSCGLNYYDEVRNAVIANGSYSDGHWLVAEKEYASSSETITGIYAYSDKISVCRLTEYSTGSTGFFSMDINPSVTGMYDWVYQYEGTYSTSRMRGTVVASGISWSSESLSYSSLTGSNTASFMSEMACSALILLVSNLNDMLESYDFDFSMAQFGFKL